MPYSQRISSTSTVYDAPVLHTRTDRCRRYVICSASRLPLLSSHTSRPALLDPSNFSRSRSPLLRSENFMKCNAYTAISARLRPPGGSIPLSLANARLKRRLFRLLTPLSLSPPPGDQQRPDWHAVIDPARRSVDPCFRRCLNSWDLEFKSHPHPLPALYQCCLSRTLSISCSCFAFGTCHYIAFRVLYSRKEKT